MSTLTRGSLVFEAYGHPAPQGSKRHVGNGVMIESSKRHKPWREAVKYAALDAMDGAPMEGPLAVCLVFCFDRPKSHYRTGKNAHLLRDDAPFAPANAASPDIDKLARTVLDACTDAGVWRDDSQVIALTARKLYTNDGHDSLHIPGVRVLVGTA